MPVEKAIKTCEIRPDRHRQDRREVPRPSSGCKRSPGRVGALEHASIPQHDGCHPEMSCSMRERMADSKTMSDEMLVAINSMEQLDLVQQLNDVTHEMQYTTREIKALPANHCDHPGHRRFRQAVA